MTEKHIYLTGYGYTPGTPEAEQAWKTKCIFMVKKWPDHYLADMYRSYLTESDMPQELARAPMVMGDIQPYKSQIDGSMIESRSRHRAHLKQHNCIEVGNETKHLTSKQAVAPRDLKDDIIRATYARK